MEIEEVKKITRYNGYTVNEFIRGLVKARGDIENAKEELAQRADKVTENLENVETEITEEEIKQNAEEVENIKQEKKRIEKILSNWEKEKERIHGILTKKKEKNEQKITENEQKITGLESNIQANEEKMKDLDQESNEYKELEKENISLRRKISSARGNITRYTKQMNNLIEIIGNLETEKVLEGLTIERASTLPGKNIRKLAVENGDKKIITADVPKHEETVAEPEISEERLNLEKQIRKSAERMKEYKENGNYEQEAAERAYYSKLVSKLSELNTAEPEEKKTEETVEDETAKEILSLEEQIRKSAERMKEYKENGNYEQEAAERAYYSELVSKLSGLKANKEEPVKATRTTTEQQSAQTVKATRTTTEQQPAQTVKATRTTTEQQPAQTVKATRTTTEQQPAQTTKQEIVQWNSKLTPEQIEELIAEGIKPGDNEYDLYLWNHGINPFESQIRTKAEQKPEIDEVLQKYSNDGFGQNAFGWYFNPWTSEYDKDYDPHKDKAYNDKIEEMESTIEQEEPKTEKISVKERIKAAIGNFVRTIKTYINNFNNKRLPEGAAKEDVDKANGILEETLSDKEHIYSQSSIRAMQGRNEFVSKVHIPDELMKKIEADETINSEKTEEIEQDER